MVKTIELLAPAKDAATAITAVRCGADAVYIGAERFGARDQAGNTIEAIQEAADFAHKYYAKIYVTLNTLLFDIELQAAQKLVEQLYGIGIDGLIIQDAGLLELDLPPIPLIASTQMNNATVEKIEFLQDIGFSRVILARELTLDEIRNIRSKTTVDLECFIHGALCVGQSGQCYMSYVIGGRSGNRGQCAQPCRRVYALRDRQGNVIVKGRHLLSLKDLNLSAYLEDLIDAGITTFKIEGRLKDIPYVVNTVGFYRKLLDGILTKKGLQKASSGSVKLDFEPNPEKTFNRGFTDYGFTGKAEKMLSIDTPKSIGEFVGRVSEVGKNYFILDSRLRGNDNKNSSQLHNADGICFFDNTRNLSGTVVNRVEDRKIYPQKNSEIRVGQEIYRNFDYEFDRKLTGRAAERKIGLSIIVRETQQGLIITGKDEDDNETIVEITGPKQPAEKKEAAKQTIITQLAKLGNTIFECLDVKLETKDVYFWPVSKLNEARRELIKRLLEVREVNRPRKQGGIVKNNVPYPEKHLTWTGNVLNAKAEAFYRRHGVETIEQGAERGIDLTGETVMTTKMCLRRELNLCPKSGSKEKAEPLTLIDEPFDPAQVRQDKAFELKFKCGHCGMEVVLSATPAVDKQ